MKMGLLIVVSCGSALFGARESKGLPCERENVCAPRSAANAPRMHVVRPPRLNVPPLL